MTNLNISLHNQKICLQCNNPQIIFDSLIGLNFTESSDTNQETDILAITELKDKQLVWSIKDKHQDKDISGTTLGDFAYHLSDCLVFYFADKIKDAFCIHAGSVAYDEKVFMIVGQSGAGKSTFTAWLISQGAHYLTDELTIIDKQSRIYGLARPIQIKRHGVEIASTLVKDKQTLISGDSVTGIPASALSTQHNNHDPSKNSLAGIVFINYQKQADFQLVKLSPAESGMKIMQNFVNARNLDNFGFTELMSIIEKVPSYNLQYSNFKDCENIFSSIL